MNAIHDPNFTARLEPALTILANQPTRALHYLEDRFELETGELQAWLNEFNGGHKTLRFDRLHAVKHALAHGKVPAAFVPPPPPSLAPIDEPPSKREPVGERVAPPMPEFPPEDPAILAQGEKIKAGLKKIRAEKRETPAADAPVIMRDASKNMHKTNANLHTSPARPWETTARTFKPKVFLGWRPIFEKIAGGADRNALCRAANVTTEGLALYCLGWLGSRLGHSPQTLREFLVWGDAQCASRAGKPRSAQSPALGASPAPGVAKPTKDDWDQWRSDAIAALRAMGTPALRATAQVDAAIAKLNGEDIDAGELVKRAMRETAIEPTKRSNIPPQSASRPMGRSDARAQPEPRPLAPARAAAPPALSIGGDLFKLEVIVRLVPLAKQTPPPL